MVQPSCFSTIESNLTKLRLEEKSSLFPFINNLSCNPFADGSTGNQTKWQHYDKAKWYGLVEWKL
jgi:hypothetical protein